MTKTNLVLLFLLGISLARCGIPEGRGSGASHAVEIPGPGGVRCFAIMDYDGNVRGGNCK